MHFDLYFFNLVASDQNALYLPVAIPGSVLRQVAFWAEILKF